VIAATSTIHKTNPTVSDPHLSSHWQKTQLGTRSQMGTERRDHSQAADCWLEPDSEPPSNCTKADEVEAPAKHTAAFHAAPFLEPVTESELELTVERECEVDNNDDVEEVHSDFPSEPTVPKESEATKWTASDKKPCPKTLLCLLFAWMMAVPAAFLQAWVEICWKVPEEDSCLVPLSSHFCHLPLAWLVLTNAIMVSMWWIGVCLAHWQDDWEHFHAAQGPRLPFWPK